MRQYTLFICFIFSLHHFNFYDDAGGETENHDKRNVIENRISNPGVPKKPHHPVNTQLKLKVKSSLHYRYYAKACNEWRRRISSPRLSVWATQLRTNVAAMASR